MTDKKVPIPGCYNWQENGYECAECGKTIEPGEDAIRVDYAEITEDDMGPRVWTKNFGGIFHSECI